MTHLSWPRYRDSIRADALRIADLVEAMPTEANPAVEACPDWGVREVTTHLGAVHRMVVTATAGVASRSKQYWPDEDVDLLAWLRQGMEEMLAVLDQSADTPAWSFAPQGQSIGFWQRRQAMENLIHRIDVEQALGEPSPVDTDVADDAVSEIIDTLMPIPLDAGKLTLPSGTITLTASDTSTTWTVGEGEPQTTISGRAEDLARGLWHRASEPLAITGDKDVAQAFLASQLTP